MEKAASVNDIPEGKMISVRAGEKEILIARNKGKYHAVGNICTHMGCRLSGGTLKDGILTCPCHHSMFDIMTGNVVGGPARKPLPAFGTKVENGYVMVDV